MIYYRKLAVLKGYCVQTHQSAAPHLPEIVTDMVLMS